MFVLHSSILHSHIALFQGFAEVPSLAAPSFRYFVINFNPLQYTHINLRRQHECRYSHVHAELKWSPLSP